MGSIEAIAAAKAELVRRAARRAARRSCPPGEPLLDAHRRDDVTTVTFGPGGDVDALPDGPGASPFTSAHMRRNALAALAAARAVGRRARRSVGRRAVEPARPADRAARRHRRRQRLLQRQPDVDARRTRRPRRVRVRTPRRRARGHARARARRGSLPRRDRRPRPRGRASTCSSPSARAPRTWPTATARSIAAARRRRRRPPPSRACWRPGDTVLLKGSRGVGLEVVARALEGA